MLLPATTHVPVAGYAVLRTLGILSSVGLGSCVALMLHDPRTQVGAMAHILLPHEAMSRDRNRPAKFGSTATAFLLDEMRRFGAVGEPTARIVGGASMFGALLSKGINMGERNVIAVRQSLREAGVAIVADDVGGDYGRSVYFDVSTGAVRVTSMRHGERTL
jgi:chemotaxis protein CheD